MSSRNDYLATDLHILHDISHFGDVMSYCDEVVEKIFYSSPIWDDEVIQR